MGPSSSSWSASWRSWERSFSRRSRVSSGGRSPSASRRGCSSAPFPSVAWCPPCGRFAMGSARRPAGVHLVSRRTDDLDAGATAGAAVESLAENLTDSWVAPLCFYLAAGLPGAWLYRAVNTADAMIGYREGLLEQLGGASARLDDMLNWIPARLGALALCLGAWLGHESGKRAWRTMRRDGGLTASPNAGRTMAAMAGALGVTLEKRGHYRLGDGPPPDPEAIDRPPPVARRAAPPGTPAPGP